MTVRRTMTPLLPAPSSQAAPTTPAIAIDVPARGPLVNLQRVSIATACWAAAAAGCPDALSGCTQVASSKTANARTIGARTGDCDTGHPLPWRDDARRIHPNHGTRNREAS